MNLIWILLILASLAYGLLTGSVSSVNQVIVNVGRETLELALPLVAATCFWSGILNIAREVGLLNMLQKLLSPLLRFLFPDLRDDPEALGYIVTNVVVNMFGLGSAATPAGLQAMKLLQQENPDPKRASRPMVTFLVLNTAGVTLFSTSIIAIRAAFRSQDVLSFLPFAILATVFASLIGLAVDRWWNYRG